MMQGIPGYFCVDINCEIPLHPTLNGQKYPPLLTQDKIDQAMRENEAKAMREYYNLFDKTGGTDAMIKRYEITRNEKDYLPEYEFRPISDKSIDRHYAICFDPAAQLDNSFALVGEVYRDPKLGWRGRIVNGVNLIDRLPDGTKKPLRTNEQLQIIRQMIVNYNGNNPEYQNCQLIVDIGAGGGGRTYCERLWEDWTDHEGQLHRGVIDSTDPDASRQMDKYPHAVDCCRMVEPKKWRQQMFGWLCELVQQDLITFPCCLPKNHELELEEKIKILTQEEIYSYVELDLMKEEVVNFIREKSSTTGQVMYHLPHNVIRKMHDDRAYCLALFAWHIMTLRNDEIYGDTTVATDYEYLLNYPHSHKIKQNPFADRTNPFGRK